MPGLTPFGVRVSAGHVPFTPASLSGLQLWLDGHVGLTSTAWTDRGPNGWHAGNDPVGNPVTLGFNFTPNGTLCAQIITSPYSAFMRTGIVGPAWTAGLTILTYSVPFETAVTCNGPLNLQGGTGFPIPEIVLDQQGAGVCVLGGVGSNQDYVAGNGFGRASGSPIALGVSVAGTWHADAMVVDPVSNTNRSYRDGVLITEIGPAVAQSGQLLNGYFIGGSSLTPRFDMGVASALLYNRALSAREIGQILTWTHAQYG